MIRNTFKLFQSSSVTNITTRNYAVRYAEYAAPSSFLDKVQINERVIHVLKNHSGVESSKVTPQAHLNKDLNLDSLDAAELIGQIEQEFSIEIPNTDYFKLITVDQIVHYVASSPIAK